MQTDSNVMPGDVLSLWREAGPARWFSRDDAFDAHLRACLGEAHLRASRRELDAWAATPDGALALVLLLDQIPRNLYRGSAHAFATDPLALHVAAAAIDAGFDRHVDPGLRLFLYLPFEHSERIADQDRAVELIRPLGDDLLDYAQAHRDCIRRFGRFPHRNAALGRDTTAEEQAWLDAGGGFG